MDMIEKYIPGFSAFLEANMIFSIMLLIFIFVLLLTLAVTQIFTLRNNVRRRAHALSAAVSFNDGFGPAASFQSSQSDKNDSNTDLLTSVERGLFKPAYTDSAKLRNELIKAGFYSPNALYWYFAIVVTGAIAIPTLLLSGITYLQIVFPPFFKFILCICASLLAVLLPKIFITKRQQILQDECWNGFPDFMDLMVVSAEAGLTPRNSIERISREIAYTYPYLGANLYYINLELQAGCPLFEAVENFARRVGIEEILSLGSLLQQTEDLGTSLTDTLRIYSNEMRDKRMSRAEEKAYALPVKLVLPLGIYIFPVMLVVIMLPIFIRVKNALF